MTDLFDPTDHPEFHHGDVPTLDDQTGPLLLAMQLREAYPMHDPFDLCTVALHISRTVQDLRAPILRLTRATLTFQLDPDTRNVEIVGTVPERGEDPNAGVTGIHLAGLLIQERFVQTRRDESFRLNLYTVAYRALLISQDNYVPGDSFNEALDMARAALAAPLPDNVTSTGN